MATLSYVSWESATLEQRFRVRLARPVAQTFLYLGGLFFCVGLAGTADVTWQRVLWILLTLGFVFQLGSEIYRRKQTVAKDDTSLP